MGRGGDGAGGRGQEKCEPEGSETNAEREAIRQGLLRFARDVAGTEDKPEMIDVLTGVEAYVDEVVEALDL